ncbi:peptide/nickel transport system permease protein [Sphaerochaeta associata]|jgi:peptide/nickel transport system permease protein|uniref:ABC transporter permease n=2 Tax=root TaxID=1 RepID=A0ABY4D880_9SPIR|nr:ABC transporter permease [Sphaerochaeta associata]UOM50279.1 ABC transporter permease [Sphaerochaeta associata]SMP43233.1 peptide/nickel transport system permease protein [Sphaerochaeta associata]
MLKYISKRLLISIPVIIGITILSFIIMKLSPGDPLANFINPSIDMADLEKSRQALGLNDPLYVQYFKWIGQVAKGNFGYTYSGNHSISGLILERLPNTVILTLSAFVMSFVVGIPLGVIGAVKKNTRTDYGITLMSLVGVAIPSFFFGLLVIYVFALMLGIFPSGGMVNIRAGYTGFAYYTDILHHLVLPAVVLSLGNIASVSRFTRSNMLDILKEDYIRTAKAKGLRNKAVIYRHALRNALIPVVTIFGLSIPFLFSGAYITESIFNWPGMGQLGIRAIQDREYGIIMALNLITATLVLTGNLISDILYAIVDPRIRH